MFALEILAFLPLFHCVQSNRTTNSKYIFGIQYAWTNFECTFTLGVERKIYAVDIHLLSE